MSEIDIVDTQKPVIETEPLSAGVFGDRTDRVKKLPDANVYYSVAFGIDEREYS